MQKVTYKEARKRYMRLFWPVMGFYVLAVMGGSYLAGQYEETPQWLGITLALVISFPLIGVLFLMVRYFREADEYTRLMQLTAFAYGACLVIGAIFIVGFLQMFDVLGYVDVFWFGPGFFLAYGLSYKAMGGKDCT